MLKARLVWIGNSKGIRLPKPVLEQTRLTEEVVLQVKDRSIIVSSARRPREAWADAAKRLRAETRGGLLDPSRPTRFDEEEWEW
jgi:antitoxin MazE